MYIYMHENDQQTAQGKVQEAHAEGEPQNKPAKGPPPEAHISYVTYIY